MKNVSWQGVVLVASLVIGGVVAGVFGQTEAASLLIVGGLTLAVPSVVAKRGKQ